MPQKNLSRSAKAISSGLVRWFNRNQRDLPWRHTRDPYAIWISEIMLQQTQVKTVIPYFERWMGNLPNIATFASANLDQILKLWEGLGYYRRVRHAQKAAQIILERFDGRFPNQFDDVLSLPGVGRYTAGAICSMAFNSPTPILDGNVIRVLTRLYGISGNPRDKKVNVVLWTAAQDLVSAAKDRSALNQGLMELGALICTPRQAKCSLCPLKARCFALQNGKVELFPMLEERASVTHRRVAAFIVRKDDRYLVSQRPAEIVNGSLWEFPSVENGVPGGLFAALHPKPMYQVRHSITRYRILLEAFPGRLIARRQPPNSRWGTLAELEALPFTSAHRKILRHLRNAPAISV